jgi:hypothetical protein
LPIADGTTSNLSLVTRHYATSSWAMTDETLQDASGLYDHQIVEWDGPPVHLSNEQIEEVKRRHAQDWDPFAPIDHTDAFIAGWGDALTAGLSTRVRAALYGNDATRNHSGKYFEGGRQVGPMTVARECA